MRCPKCGTEIREGAKFCTFCGTNIQQLKIQGNENLRNEEVELKYKDTKQTANDMKESEAITTDKLKDRFSEYWNGLNLFGKVSIVSLIVIVLACLFAFLIGKPFAGAVAVFQIFLVIISVLLKRQIIKTSKQWLWMVSFILAGVLLVLYFNFIRVQKIDAEKYAWSEIIMSHIVPEPESHLGKLVNNSGDHLNLYVYKTTGKCYSDYINLCKNKGFNVDVEQNDSMFEAYNEAGYKLSLSYNKKDERMDISVGAPIDLGTFTWPTNGMSQFIPAPQSTIGRIDMNDKAGFQATVGGMNITEFKEYTRACVQKGFSFESLENDKSFYAKNADGYRLNVNYEGNNTVLISIVEPEYNVKFEVRCKENLLFSKYNVEIYIDGYHEGTLSHGTTATYSKVLKKGEYELKFVNAEDSTVTGSISVSVTKDSKYIFEISCTSTGILVDPVTDNVSKVEEPAPETESTVVEKETEENVTAEETNHLMKSLEANIPLEMAKRAVIVAMTNCHATDVCTADGNNLDPSKFHAYSDLSGYFVTIDTDGTWTALDAQTWHVEGLILRIYEYDTYLKVSGDVTKHENDYVVSNVDRRISSKEYLDSDDPTKINEEHFEPSKINPYLTVAPELIEKDRDKEEESRKLEEENKKIKAKAERQDWINNQFSIWSGSHKELEKLIKKSLNDEKSYKFISSDYVDIYDESMKKTINDALKDLDVYDRVEVGDILVITEFSAKNAFNATIKSRAYGIVRHSDNSTILVFME